MASLSVKEIEDIIKNKQAIYDLSVDKTVNKVGTGKKLEKFAINKFWLHENSFSPFPSILDSVKTENYFQWSTTMIINFIYFEIQRSIKWRLTPKKIKCEQRQSRFP